MTHFLVVFDRDAGSITHMETFVDGAEALRARFAYERTHDLGQNVEVVVLVSDSKEALVRTHGRYFNRMTELVENALQRKVTAKPEPKKSRWKAFSRLVGRTA